MKLPCPLCHDAATMRLVPDRALVAAFLCGGDARAANVSNDDALCPKHAALAKDALQFRANLEKRVMS